MSVLTNKMMQIDAIERYVDQVLEVNGVVKGTEGQERLLLSHLYTAVGMYQLLDKTQKAHIAMLQKQLRHFFYAKCDLKERKRKKDKEKTPLHPSIKEKENKEKEQKTIYLAKRNFLNSLDEREQVFYDECQKLRDKYNPELVDDFYCHWSEEDKTDSKMLFEYEKTWNTAKRMRKWDSNPISRAKKAAEQRLEKAKAKSKEADSAKQQQTAIERDDANEKLFQQLEENKKKAVSYKEYLRKKNENAE